MKSARINFGQPNTEYKLEINEAGEATSCYNQDTETEYIGGGGGGDFSTAKVTIYNTGIEDTVVCRIPVTYDDPKTSGTEVLANHNETAIYNVILYKGTAIGHIQSENWDDDPVCTGDITFNGNDFIITGNGTITFIG